MRLQVAYIARDYSCVYTYAKQGSCWSGARPYAGTFTICAQSARAHNQLISAFARQSRRPIIGDSLVVVHSYW